MKESYLPTLLQMRMLVGFLGERAQYAWWPTAFYEASSRLFLEPVFSKTSRLAQYHGVLEAARRLHDEHLSVVRAASLRSVGSAAPGEVLPASVMEITLP